MTRSKASFFSGFVVALAIGCSLVMSSCVRHAAKPPVVTDMPVILPPEEPSTGPSAEPGSAPRPRPPLKKKTETKVRVKIGLRTEADVVTFSCDSSIVVSEPNSKTTKLLAPGKHTIRVSNGDLTINGKPMASTFTLKPEAAGIHLVSNEKEYRGEFIVKKMGGGVTLINHLNLDDYLKGVLPREVVVTWAFESLKVQAVASRSYLASHLGRHGTQGYDLCSDVHCQVYGGMGKEHPSTNQAVDDTAGEILTQSGKAISAYFHSNCGGTTEQVEHVWGLTSQTYLPRKSCSYGTKDPRYNWKFTYSNDDMLQILKKKTTVTGSNLKSIRIIRKSHSGRAARVSVRTDDGDFEMSGNQFRVSLNPEKIRSTLWTLVRKTGQGYEFHGKGWGHGVGMCQWGAKGQAEIGRKYEQILAFYYPHTKLTIWSHR
jgi:stage II sporulation protein D